MFVLMIAVAAASPVSALPKPPVDRAQIVFFRSGTVLGSVISCAVHEKDYKLTSLPPGKYSVLTVAPGPHDFVVRSEAINTLRIDARAGQTYFAKCTVGFGLAVGHPHLHPSSRTEFNRMGGKLRQESAPSVSDFANDEMDSSQGDARTVMARQFASPPRAGAAAGVSAEEADVIMQHYIASIGKRLDPIVTTVGAPQQ
jgi:hypothetical protein